MSKFVQEYKVKLLGKQIIANDTYSFVFSKPEGFAYKAGQFIKVRLPVCDCGSEEDDDKGCVRYLAISSPPLSNEIAIAFRMTYTPFKDYLMNMKIGDELFIKGPYGKIIFDDDAKEGIVFLAGGIGVSTVHPYILDALQRRLRTPMWLFLSNHTSMDTPWFHCLRELQSPYLKIIFTMTRPHEELTPWAGNTDHINIDMIKKYIKHLRKKKYVIVGRDTFVEQMKTKLMIIGIPRENIRARIYVF